MLNPKQKQFVAEYLIDFNATAAYKRAGYKWGSETAARANSARLIANDNIQEAIKEGMAAIAKRNEITQDWVIEVLKNNIARASQAEPVTDSEGNPIGIYNYQGSVVNRAAELIGKHIGMFPDRVHVGGDKDAPPIKTRYDADGTPIDTYKWTIDLANKLAGERHSRNDSGPAHSHNGSGESVPAPHTNGKASSIPG